MSKGVNYEHGITSSLDEIAKLHVRSKRFKEAICNFTERLERTEDGTVHKCWILHDIGRSYFELGQYSKALTFGLQSIEIADTLTDDRWKLNSRVLVAQTYMRQELKDDAYDVYTSAHATSKRLGDVHASNIIFKAMEGLKGVVL